MLLKVFTDKRLNGCVAMCPNGRVAMRPNGRAAMCPNGCAAMRAYTSSAAVREIACAAARVCVRTAMCARVAAQMRAWGSARSRPRGCGCAPLPPWKPAEGSRALVELVEPLPKDRGRWWSPCRPCCRSWARRETV